VESSPAAAGIVVFGEFEAHLRPRELRRRGIRVRLPDQSFLVLAMLLEHPGDLVTREDIQKRLWPGDSFVDFDHGLNNAVNRLREALGDSAGVPLFVETLPRRGYRFIGAVNGVAREDTCATDTETEAQRDLKPVLSNALREQHRIPHLRIAVPVAGCLVLLVLGIGLLLHSRTTAVPVHSLVVLPLENLSGDPLQDYLADGLTDALTTDLAIISSLRVISRTSATHYKGLHQPLPEIARELNVDAVVEGSVVRSGNRVRVTARLVHAGSDRHLWAKTYDRDMSEILSVQQDVAQNIVREIRAKLTPTEEARLLTAVPEVNTDAYSDYLLGASYLRRRSLDGYNRALVLFQQAIAASPTYAPAYAGLADSYNLLGLGMGSFSAIEAANRARAAARKALELDPNLAEAHAALAFTLCRYDWNWAEGGKENQRAIELEPSVKAADVQPMHDIDPLSVQGVRYITGAYIAAKQYDKATLYYKKAIELQVDSFRLRMDLATGYSSAGRYPEAVEELQKVITTYGTNVFPQAELAYAYARWGRSSEAEKIIDQLKKTATPGYSSYAIAKIYGGLGRKQEALKWLQRAYREHAPEMANFDGDPAFASLHEDSRFQDLELKVGIPAYSDCR
jgi:TolB-like protein/DNA-binding winged helix-turn-helix (wHTH) protein